MSEEIDSDEVFRPLDKAEVATLAMRLSDYGFEAQAGLSTGSPHTDLLLDSAWTNHNGFENATSRRVHLMYLHLYGTSGQTIRGEIQDVDRSRAFKQMLELDWPEDDLETVVNAVDEEKERRQALLWETLPSGRIPLFRGIHCMSADYESGEATVLQQWAMTIIRKGILDGTVQIDDESNQPAGFVRSVEPFTSTVDGWTCSYNGAAYWSRTRLPGNEICMVMAAHVAHAGVVLWRNDSLGMDEVFVLGGPGPINVYFQDQIADKATPSEIESW